MRIAHFATEYPPCITGGLGRHVEELIKELKRRADIDLYLPFLEPSLDKVSDISIFQTIVPSRTITPFSSYTKKFIFRLGFYMASRCLSTGRNYDAIHCHDWLTGISGVLLKHILGKKLVVTCHLPQFSPDEASIEKLVVRECDTVIAVSESVKELLIEKYNLSPNKIITIYNGVDTTFYSPSPVKRDPCTILFVGRVVPQKGLEVLIYSLKYLIPKLPQVKLVVVGDGDWLQDAKNIARTCGYPNRIEFCGWKPREELVQYYQRSTVFAMPSQFEPFGLTALEAMASGMPVVASRVGGLEEIIEQGRNGFLVDPKSPTAFAGRILQLLVDSNLWSTFSVEARKRAQQFSWAAVADELVSVYATRTTEPRERAAVSLARAYINIWRTCRRDLSQGGGI